MALALSFCPFDMCLALLEYWRTVWRRADEIGAMTAVVLSSERRNPKSTLTFGVSLGVYVILSRTSSYACSSWRGLQVLVCLSCSETIRIYRETWSCALCVTRSDE